MRQYLVNQNGHYFAVECVIDIEAANCQQFETLSDMYDHICQSQNLHLDEIEGSEIWFNKDGVEYDGRGCPAERYEEDIDKTIRNKLKKMRDANTNKRKSSLPSFFSKSS